MKYIIDTDDLPCGEDKCCECPFYDAEALCMIHSILEEHFPKYSGKQGKWIDGYCSECGKPCYCDGWGLDVKSEYCPRCGAKLEESEKEEDDEID